VRFPEEYVRSTEIHSFKTNQGPNGSNNKGSRVCCLHRRGHLRHPFYSGQRFSHREALSHLVESAGIWAPLLFILVYAVGVCLFVPGTLLTVLGRPSRRVFWIFVCLDRSHDRASVAFWIGRTLGREFAASMVGDRLKKYDDAVARNGLATVLYLRLVYFPFTPMNFGMGLTKVRFRDYFAGRD